MVLRALQEPQMFYGVRVQLLAFQRLLLVQWCFFLPLFNFTCGVAFLAVFHLFEEVLHLL